MPHPSLNILILAAGKGTRMRSALPKVLHPLAGFPLIWHVRRTAEALAPQALVGIIGPEQEMDPVAVLFHPWPVAVQAERLGTGHAVQTGVAALPADTASDSLTVVLYGDTPLLQADIIRGMADRLLAVPAAALCVLGFHTADSTAAYGRLETAQGQVQAIVEYADASPAQRALTLCNSGVMVFRHGALLQLLPLLENTNSKGEYYLTDTVRHARALGLECLVAETASDAVLGVNSRAELAVLEGLLQARLRQRHLDAGVTLLAPDTVTFAADTVLAADVLIEPHVFFGPGVTVDTGVTIRGFSHIEGAAIGAGCVVGPFARLRPGTVLAEDVRIGNFVETKAARLGTGAKANHLSYLGDADIGAHSNIGAGTITCNYDGVRKSRTVLGEGVFVGSNTALVAPVTIGDGALIGAGSVITRDVEPGALALSRAEQMVKAGGAGRLRALMKRHR
jgi:bifunctional UDP-N-acetylglucosamine pyrophosphorylase / glucosamine-1-phosphate N-acetyltransferase